MVSFDIFMRSPNYTKHHIITLCLQNHNLTHSEIFLNPPKSSYSQKVAATKYLFNIIRTKYDYDLLYCVF